MQASKKECRVVVETVAVAPAANVAQAVEGKFAKIYKFCLLLLFL